MVRSQIKDRFDGASALARCMGDRKLLAASVTVAATRRQPAAIAVPAIKANSVIEGSKIKDSRADWPPEGSMIFGFCSHAATRRFMSNGAVGWPGGAIEKTKGDLLEPTQRLLEGLGLKEKDAEVQQGQKEKPFTGGADSSRTPYSLQVISAGTLQFSRSAARLVAYFGGSAGLLSAAKGVFWTDDSQLAAVYVAAAAVVLAAAVIAIATIVRSDVQARAAAQAAEYEARGKIAATFLTTARPYPAPGALPPRYFIKRTRQEPWTEVKSFDWTKDGKVVVTPVQGDSISLDEIEALTHTAAGAMP